MDEDRNSFQKGNFQGQALCREVTRSHGGLFKIGTLAFCSESIGFLECTPTGPNIAWFAYFFSLSLSPPPPSLPLSLFSLFCVGRLYVLNAHVWTYFLYSHPLSRPYNMTGLPPENLQYALVYCSPLFEERSQHFLVKLFSSMSCPYKMTGPFQTPTKWVAVLISCFTCFKRSGSRLRRIYLIVFGSPPAIERSPQGSLCILGESPQESRREKKEKNKNKKNKKNNAGKQNRKTEAACVATFAVTTYWPYTKLVPPPAK